MPNILKKILPTVLLLFAASPSFGQGRILFDKTEHDFGAFREEKGKVSVGFEFVNQGDKPLTILDVKAACGCTTPTWPKDPVPAGGKGTLTAIYDATDRPGAFNKGITVMLDGIPQIVQLTIKGEVVGRAKGIADFYPSSDGNFRFNTTHLGFGKSYYDAPNKKKIKILNSGSKDITLFGSKMQVPANFSFETKDVLLKAGDSLTMDYTFTPSESQEYGFLFDSFQLLTDDDMQPAKRISWSADLREKFDMAALGENIPELQFDKTDIDLGTIKEGEKVVAVFNITNTGKAPLIIRKTKASCGCTMSNIEKKEVPPGQRTHIEVVFDSAGREGEQMKSITVISNDPKKDVVLLFLKAKVAKKQE